MRIDFVERQAMYARARQERAEAIYNLLIAPLVRFLSRASAGGSEPRSPQRHVAA